MEKDRKEKVTVITVTYNRTKTLQKCVEALLKQTYPVDEIIIVDNNSCEEEKRRIEAIAEQHDCIRLIYLKENRGGAGGFEAGMRAAREPGADWYWLMDDDAYPRKECLETLLKYGRQLPDVGGVCPLIYGIDLRKFQLFHHKKISRLMMKNRPVAEQYEDLEAITEEDANAFVGPLFPKAVVDEMGVADGSLFIYGDDSEYTYRVSRKYKLYLAREAVIEHQDAPVTNDNMSPKGWWKEYYCNRNQFFMIREFHKNVILRYMAYGLFAARLTAIMVKSKIKGYHKLRSQLIVRAMHDGLRNRRGKIIDPQRYLDYLEKEKI